MAVGSDGDAARLPDARLPADLDDRIDRLLSAGGRVLGITGPPGAGKSTLAAAVVRRLGGRACELPMDGFHLAGEELVRLGRADRKGAPDTFDVDGYVHALTRVRRRDRDVLVPRFRREIEEPVAGAIRIAVGCQLVVTEGNYLLLDRDGWERVAPLLDECWYLSPDDDVRRRRLVERHVEHGRTPEAAAAWVRTVDEPNAELVRTCLARADLVVGPGGC